jgi:hypothetical protein
MLAIGDRRRELRRPRNDIIGTDFVSAGSAHSALRSTHGFASALYTAGPRVSTPHRRGTVMSNDDNSLRHHTTKMKKRLEETIAHLRQDIEKVDELQLKAMFRDVGRSARRAVKGLHRL